MINQRLIAEVFNQPWCIEENYAQAMVMASLGLLKATTRQDWIMPYAIDSKNNVQSSNYQKGSVGVITLDGPVVENSDPWYGIKGTGQLSTEFQQMYTDPNISGVLFACNTGGGAAYAMKVLEDTFDTRTKPMGLFAKQTLCSAGYDLAVSADFIMMFHPQGISGSIGTMCEFANMEPMFEKWGVEFHKVYATLSTLKNKTFTDAQAGDYKALISKMLDPFNNSFHARVKDLRGDKLDADEKGIFKGETYMAAQAMQLGLIDSIGNQNDAIQEVRNLAGTGVISTKPSVSKPNSSTQQNTIMKYPKLTALLTALEGGTAPTQEELDAVNAELAANGVKAIGLFPLSLATDLSAAQTELVTASANVDRLTGELTTATGSVTTLTSENTVLRAKVAKGPAAAAPVVDNKDPNTDKTPEQKGQEIISSLPHNQGILNNPLFQKN